MSTRTASAVMLTTIPLIWLEAGAVVGDRTADILALVGGQFILEGEGWLRRGFAANGDAGFGLLFGEVGGDGFFVDDFGAQGLISDMYGKGLFDFQLGQNNTRPPCFYDCEMSEASATLEATQSGHAQKYTRNNPYTSAVTENYRLTAEGSEKETRHVALELEEGMQYTPATRWASWPRTAERSGPGAYALGFTGEERCWTLQS